MKVNLLYFSLSLNAIFIVAFLFLIVKFKTKINEWLHPHTDKNTTIVMLGNSLTKRGNWEDLLNRKDIVNSGLDGYTTSQYIIYLDKVVYPYKPKICFIEGGINDISTGVTVERTIKNLKQIVIKLKEQNIIPVIQSTPLTEKDTVANHIIDHINDEIKAYALKNNIEYLDLNEVLSTDGHLKAEFSSDGVHLTESAYNPWKIKVESILTKYKL